MLLQMQLLTTQMEMLKQRLVIGLCSIALGSLSIPNHGKINSPHVVAPMARFCSLKIITLALVLVLLITLPVIQVSDE